MRSATLVLLLTSLLSACADTRAQGVNQALEIPGPAGVRCFVVLSGETAVGGNCIPE